MRRLVLLATVAATVRIFWDDSHQRVFATNDQLQELFSSPNVLLQGTDANATRVQQEPPQLVLAEEGGVEHDERAEPKVVADQNATSTRVQEPQVLAKMEVKHDGRPEPKVPNQNATRVQEQPNVEYHDRPEEEQAAIDIALADDTSTIYTSSIMDHAAPWDPIHAGVGGSERLQGPCFQEINDACNATYPVKACLERAFAATQPNQKKVGTACRNTLSPCALDAKSNACDSTKSFQPQLPEEDVLGLERLLLMLDEAAAAVKAIYWLTAGSSLGTILHHGRIPWDDDVDVYVLDEHTPKLFEYLREELSLTVLEREKGKIFKLYERNNKTRIVNTGTGQRWPNIDIFPIFCEEKSYCLEKAFSQRKEPHIMNKSDVFPLKRRPFGRLSLPFPKKVHLLAKERYGPSFGNRCVKGGIDHTTDRFFRRRKRSSNCTDLHFYPSFVGSPETPWQNHPEYTVESLTDGDTILSTVTFVDGNEAKRCYRDGLLGVTGSKLCHLQPIRRLVPFLKSERESYARNFANRPPKDLNLEVLPLLDQVEISNKFVKKDQEEEVPANLKVMFWNAERGTDWNIFATSFAEDADIIILNEMDWGMARSGNIHTTMHLADHMKMNYAYGVEFMELTNGNAKEINATNGLLNEIGYHGNALLSKWPLKNAKIVRLHPLYDLLYNLRTEGQAAGERRLGGRMALFATTHFPDGREVLLVSVHSHGGAKARSLVRDARDICHELKTTYDSSSAVFLAGDMARTLVNELSQACSTLSLQESNDMKKTWKVECKDGSAPKARFERGDWLIARGGGANLTVSNPKTIHAATRNQQGKFECLSDHSIIELDATLS